MQNHAAFRWTGKSEQAARLAADDKLGDEAIAIECGVSRDSLTRWRRHLDFQARIAEHVTAQRAAIKAEGIANKQNRLARLNEDWQRMQALRDARAAAATGEAPGDSTGLLVRQETPTRNGTVIEYAFDRALMTEIRAHEEQAAKELGQWTEKRELTGKDGGPVQVRPDFSALTTEDLHALETIAQRALGSGGDSS